jgi:hypothetical protein
MRARGQFAIAVALATCAAPAGAGAATPASGSPLHRLATASGGIAAVAYAGPMRLYATPSALMRVGPSGRARQLLRLHGGPIQLEASPTTVALTEQRGSSMTLLTGPPTGPLRVIAHCRGRSAEIPYSPLAVAGRLVAEALTCAHGSSPGATRIRIHDGHTVRTLAAEPGRRFTWLAGAPGELATGTVAKGTEEPVRLEVRDIDTGAVRYAIEGVTGAGVDPTFVVDKRGTAVFCPSFRSLAWASPAEPRAHRIPHSDCPYVGELAFAHGTIAFWEHHERIRVGDLAGHVRTLMHPADGQAFDWDGRRLLVRGLDCADDFLGELRPGAQSYRGPSCDVHVAAVTRESDDRSVAVRLDCPQGCRGDLALGVGAGGGDVSYRVSGPGGTVHVALEDRVRRELSRYRSVPWHATVFYVNPSNGGGSMPSNEAGGALPGDGSLAYPPPPPPAPET